MLILLAHRKVTYLALVPLNFSYFNAGNDRAVFDLVEVIVAVLQDLLGCVINLKLIQSVQKVRNLRRLLICHATAPSLSS